MLGLADRAAGHRPLRGRHARRHRRRRSPGCKGLYDVGADPAVVLEDLAAFTHVVTRLKLAPAAVDDDALTEEERTRGRDFAGEALASRPRPRLADAAEGHRGGEGGDASARRGRHGARPPRPCRRPADARRGAAGRWARTAVPPRDARIASAPPRGRCGGDGGPRLAAAGGGVGRGPTGPAAERQPAPPQPGSPRSQRFEDLVALAGAKRELKLKHALEHMVRVDPLRGRPDRDRPSPTERRPGLAGELSRQARGMDRPALDDRGRREVGDADHRRGAARRPRPARRRRPRRPGGRRGARPLSRRGDRRRAGDAAERAADDPGSRPTTRRSSQTTNLFDEDD